MVSRISEVATRIPRVAGAPQGLTLAFAGFLPVLSILSLAPALPSILRHFAGIPGAEILVPLMVTAPGLTVALLSPFAGMLVDRYGRRRLILIATFLYGFAGVAPFFVHTLPALFITRLIVGATEGFVLVIVNALFADYYPVDRRRTWITVQGLSGPFLGAGSIALSGLLTGLAWNGAFLIYGIALVIFLAMVFTLFEPVIEPRENVVSAPQGLATAFPTRVAIIICIVTFLSSMLYYVFIVQSGLAFEAAGVTSSAELGMVIGLSSLGAPIGALVFNYVSRRSSGALLLATFLLLIGAGMTGIGLSHSMAPMIAAAFVQQIGTGMTVSALIFWVSRLLPAEHRGKGFGWWNSAFFAGQFCSPLLVGAIRHAVGGILPAFVVCGLLTFAGALAIWALRGQLPAASR